MKPDLPLFWIVLVGVLLLLTVLAPFGAPPPRIRCDNPDCDYAGVGRWSKNVLLVALLFSLGVLPAVIYLLLWPRPLLCPKCGNRVKPE
jgi:hypothetical protein